MASVLIIVQLSSAEMNANCQSITTPLITMKPIGKPILILEPRIEDLAPTKTKIYNRITYPLKIQIFGNHLPKWRRDSLCRNIVNLQAIIPILSIRIIKLGISLLRRKEKKGILMVRRLF